MNKNIHGVGVALVTPFDKSGNIDYMSLGRVVDHVTEGGVDYLVALGTTAETPTLSDREKKSVLAFIKERNAGRLPLVVGCGGSDTAHVVHSIKDFDFSGVSAVLSVTPYYNKPSQEGLYQHFRKVAGESPVPVILYNVPTRTGVNMTADTTLRLANEGGNILGVKEACGTVAQLAQILCGRPAGFKVISGDDIMALPLAAMGGDGLISVAANAFPHALCAMMAAADRGDNAEASALFQKLFCALEYLFCEGSPTGIKAALAIQGLAENNLRLPLIPASEQLMERIGVIIKECGLEA